MIKFLRSLFGLSLLASSAAFPARRPLPLRSTHVCSACPITVKWSLEAVPGVAKAVVYYADKTAVVTFDGAKSAVPALISRDHQCGLPVGAQKLTPYERSRSHHHRHDWRSAGGDLLRDVDPLWSCWGIRAFGSAGQGRLHRVAGAAPRWGAGWAWALPPTHVNDVRDDTSTGEQGAQVSGGKPTILSSSATARPCRCEHSGACGGMVGCPHRSSAVRRNLCAAPLRSEVRC